MVRKASCLMACCSRHDGVEKFCDQYYSYIDKKQMKYLVVLYLFKRIDLFFDLNVKFNSIKIIGKVISKLGIIENPTCAKHRVNRG